MDELTEKLGAHVEACSVCSAANKRVNDFCVDGKLLFFEWAAQRKPLRFEEVTVSQEQYDRLVEETRRARRSGENN